MRVLLVLLLLLSSASAQLAVEDEKGDHRFGRPLYDSPSGPSMTWLDAGPLGWYPAADIWDYKIDETATALRFSLGVNSTSAGNEPALQGGTPDFSWLQYTLTFTYHGEDRAVAFDYGIGGDAYLGLYSATQFQGQDFWSLDYYTSAEERTDVAGWSAIIPKWAFRDSDLVPMRQGDVLSDLALHVSPVGSERSICPYVDPTGPGYSNDCGWELEELVEDMGEFPIAQNPPGAGHLFMRMLNPIRFSNGLETTYLYELEVHNLEAANDQFLLQVSNAPNNWEVFAPAVVDVPGDSKVVVPIATRVPFDHNHGTNVFLRLTAVSDLDPNIKMDQTFGVVFPDPPQPGGHHNRLYMHVTDDGYGGWLNTRDAENEPDATGVDIYPNEVSKTLQTADYSWLVPLNPTLRIGIDGIPGGDGSFKASFEFPAGFSGDFAAEVVLLDWQSGERIVLATGEDNGWDFVADTPKEVDIALTGTPEIDYVPYQSGRNLYLQINASGADSIVGADVGRGAPQPAMQTPNSELILPLLDYHDAVDPDSLPRTLFAITPETETYRTVNPGRTTVFAFNVTSQAENGHTLEWELRADHDFESWATITPSSQSVPAGSTGKVVIRVVPPENSLHGDTADFMLIGRSSSDSNQQVFATFVAQVDTQNDIPDLADEANNLENEAAQGAAKKSPGLFVLLPLLFALRKRL